MFIHLGGNILVHEDSVIGIFDLDNTSQSHITRNYLNTAEKNKQIFVTVEDIPKAFVVCSENNNQKVYLSQMAPTTLLKRAENPEI